MKKSDLYYGLPVQVGVGLPRPRARFWRLFGQTGSKALIIEWTHYNRPQAVIAPVDELHISGDAEPPPMPDWAR